MKKFLFPAFAALAVLGCSDKDGSPYLFGDDVLYSQCGGSDYNTGTHGCCNMTTFALPTHFCFGSTIYSKCGGQTYTSSQFCYNNNIENKCGGTITFTPVTEDCCGDNKYALASQFCHTDNTIHNKCGTATFNPSAEFCLGSTITPLCGGETYTSSQFCSGNAVHDKCGGNDYNPSTQFCSAQDSEVYNKCGGSSYNTNTHGCCNTATFALASQFCHADNTIHNKCGTATFNPSAEFCLGSTITPLCGGETYTSSQFCSGNSVYDKCGGSEYNPVTHYCHSDNKTYTCGNLPYNPATQFCYNNSKVGSKCGSRTDEYNPDLYECKPSINPGGIYLRTPVNYGSESYEAVLIGTQTWLARNLNYAASGSKCGNGTSLSDNNTISCDTYGRLYNWATAMNNASSSTAVPSGVKGVCPSGWHLPSDGEWDVLMTAVGGSSTAGTKLKAASGWNDYNGASGNGTDDYGFSALPGGHGYSDGVFYDAGSYGYWWSASEYEDYSDYAYTRFMFYYDEGALWGSNSKSYLLSVRCLQD